MKLHLVSLGCNKNLVDSEIMLGRLRDYELTADPAAADAIIVNTCGFINSAKEESIRTILELCARKKRGAVLAVTGCLTARYKDELVRALPEVDVFSGVGDFAQIDELLLARHSRFTPQTYLTQGAPRVITGSAFHAFVKISEGCNQHCSFCAIPSFKGRLQSRSIDNIAAEIRDLAARGFSDFSLLAQDSSSFGADFGRGNGGANGAGVGIFNTGGGFGAKNSADLSPNSNLTATARAQDFSQNPQTPAPNSNLTPNPISPRPAPLIDLIGEIEKIPGVRRARILYLYPTSTSFELIERIAASPVFVNYFDMPIQHISDKMLRLMRRGAGSARLRELLGAMRSVRGSFVRTGVIVGHPGEDEEDFAQLCEFLRGFAFDRISAFAYSREEGTAAHDLPQVKKSVITRRLREVERLTNAAVERSFRALVGRVVRVVINGESSEGAMFFGAKCVEWDRDIDGEILINDSEVAGLKVGGEYDCRITEFAGGGKLVGEIIARG